MKFIGALVSESDDISSGKANVLLIILAIVTFILMALLLMPSFLIKYLRTTLVWCNPQSRHKLFAKDKQSGQFVPTLMTDIFYID
jgi:hypothetical protein